MSSPTLAIGDTCVLIHRMSEEWRGKKNRCPLQVVLVRLLGKNVTLEGVYDIAFVKCLKGPLPGDEGTVAIAPCCASDALLKIPDNLRDDASILAYIKLSGHFL